jgi:hypothetical protein
VASRAVQSSLKLSAGYEESGEARREYDRGFLPVIGTRVVHGRVWTGAGARVRMARHGCAGWRAPSMSAAVEHVAWFLLLLF